MVTIRSTVVINEKDRRLTYPMELCYEFGDVFTNIDEWSSRQSQKLEEKVMRNVECFRHIEFGPVLIPNFSIRGVVKKEEKPLTDKEMLLARRCGYEFNVTHRFGSLNDDPLQKGKVATMLKYGGYSGKYESGEISRPANATEVRRRFERKRSNEKYKKLKQIDAEMRKGISWHGLTKLVREVGDLDNTYNSDAMQKWWKWQDIAEFIEHEAQIEAMSDEEVRRRLVLESI